MLSLFLSFVLSAHAGDCGPKCKTIRVLTYNIKGLPGFASPGYDEGRYDEIGKYLKERNERGDGPDIVLLQESFVERTRELREHAGYAHIADGPDKVATDINGKPKKALLNSGLYIMSHFPLAHNRLVAFEEGTCGTFDCFANKGMHQVTVQIPGVPFPLELLNTHAQSGAKFEAPRKRQFGTVGNFLSRYRSAAAAIFGGDFNTTPKLQSYELLKKTTAMRNVGETCNTRGTLCRVDQDTDGEAALHKSVDHIFYQSSRNLSIEPISLKRYFAGEKYSDHMAYEAEFELRWY